MSSKTFARVPGATYRVQLHGGFGFRAARTLVPYLQRLGVTDLYLSPVFQARRGSRHGYDVTDPTRLNPELGSARDFEALTSDLRERGMGVVLDLVPNHMAIGPENRWWMHVLENGPSSPYAAMFDSDWDEDELLGPKVLLPCLGRPYGRTLEAGELELVQEDGQFLLRYFDWKFPVDPSTWNVVLGQGLGRLRDRLGAQHDVVRRLLRVMAAVRALPPRSDENPVAAAERVRGKQEIVRQLEELRQRAEGARHLEQAVARLNGRPGDPESFDLLDRLIHQQAYRPAYWKVATETMEYRRFFDVSDLIGIRVELPSVFQATHELALRVAAEIGVTGLRIDHVDGLYDPAGYLRDLQAALPSRNGSPFYVVVEKILEDGERLPARWPTAGTTGYEFSAAVTAALCDRPGIERLTRAWRSFTGTRSSFEAILLDCKRHVLRELFQGELTRLAADLARLARRDRHARHLSRRTWFGLLGEATASLPVYRTYVRDPNVSPEDVQTLDALMDELRGRNAFPPVAVEFLRLVLLLRYPSAVPEEQHAVWPRFVMRWQQLTGPVMAKGFEDTALYVYTPLLALNEVGASPQPPGDPVAALHERLAERAGSHPHALNASSTHDTKRSEDARARLCVLSEIPAQYRAARTRWSRANARFRTEVAGGRVPDAVEEDFLYQTLLSAWPIDLARLSPVLTKSARERKVRTSWLRPDAEHEAALAAFASRILEHPRFLDDFEPFAARVAWHGALNSISQLLLKVAAPGVPDFYQGTETWNLQLVDPDNRGDVDHEAHARLLAQVEGADPGKLWNTWRDGGIKLWTTSRALAFRHGRARLFRDGRFLPVHASGRRAHHVIAFARRLGRAWCLVAVPRLTVALAPEGVLPVDPKIWNGTRLELPESAPRKWTHALTGYVVEDAGDLAALFARLPHALLDGIGG
ncbi:MAG TPA: malto-oligosyltrehalose synthase [Candidatus Polarisedimenticolaceae bacterium]|nr:malto-oligosyltrehalose synthase [Candidatus Polarisedimenticolaceae bacterium]